MTDNAAGSVALRFKSAALVFLAAYVVVTVLAFGLYLLLATMLDVPLSAPFDIRTDRAYSVAEQLYPILNLGVWTAAAWVYFRRHSLPSAKQALVLGAHWLALALVLDLLYFVLIPNPLQVTAHAFYVEQSPWIYFTYLVVLSAPTAYRALSAHGR